MIDTGIVEAARAVPIESVAQECGLQLRGRIDLVGPCPRCGGRDRFSINTVKQVFNCRGCGARGRGAIDFVMWLDGCTFPEAVERLTGEAQVEHRGQGAKTDLLVDNINKLRGENSSGGGNNVRLALTIWNEAGDPRGTVVETYLASRGLVLTDDLAGDVLRFHVRCGWYDDDGTLLFVPAMVAAMRSITTGEITGVHRTRLSVDGRKIGRRMLGVAGGAAVMLDPRAMVGAVLHLGEGIETCLAARQLGLRPVWALGSADAIGKFPLLPIARIVLLGERGIDGSPDIDNDRACAACAGRWLAVGREAIVVYRPAGGDINDAIMKQRGSRDASATSLAARD